MFIKDMRGVRVLYDNDGDILSVDQVGGPMICVGYQGVAWIERTLEGYLIHMENEDEEYLLQLENEDENL